MGGVSLASTLLFGVPAWILALTKGTAVGVVWICVRVMRPVQAWFDRTRLTPRPGEASGVLRYPRSVLLVSSIYVTFFLLGAVLEFGMFVLCVLMGGFPPIALIVFAAGSLLAFAAATYFSLPIVGYHRVRHEIEATGLRYKTLFSEGVLAWNDVKRVRYSQRLQAFRIEASEGPVILVSAMLTGLPQFALAVLRHVPWYRVDKGARPVIKQAACRHLPRALV
jgi:hypothetical protein